jgi:hypothetical protein
VTLLPFPQRSPVVSPATPAAASDPSNEWNGPAQAPSEGELPANLRFLLTPDHDPSLAYLDQLSGLDILDDIEREARIAMARHTGS